MASFRYILLATMVLAAIPSVLANCGDTLTPSEGDQVTLAITPAGSYDYLWSSTFGAGIWGLEGMDGTTTLLNGKRGKFRLLRHLVQVLHLQLLVN